MTQAEWEALVPGDRIISTDKAIKPGIVYTVNAIESTPDRMNPIQVYVNTTFLPMPIAPFPDWWSKL